MMTAHRSDLLAAMKPRPTPSASAKNTALHRLALEGLEYFHRAGDAGDREYVRAIRCVLQEAAQPSPADDELRKELDAAYAELRKIRRATKAVFDRDVWDRAAIAAEKREGS